MNTFGEIANFIWSIADLLRGPFKRGKYQDVILPFTVLRRIDCVLAPTKQKVLARNAELKGRLKDVGPQLRRASGFSFYNTSRYDFETLLADAGSLAVNLQAYINGFSDNMRTALERFKFEETIKTLEKHDLLYKVMERFKNVDLHPDVVDNHTMGSVFEHLIYKFNEALDENPGEHFTPRDVVSLMAGLLLAPDKKRLAQEQFAPMLYDPCCGTGGMLTVAKSRILADNPTAKVHLFGQEYNEETWAVCVADLLMMNPDGRDADNILQGSTLSADGHSDKRFDYMLANPPYGYDWKKDEEAVRAESAPRRPRPVLGRAPAHIGRATALPSAHARPNEAPEGRRLARLHHHERLAALHRRRRFRRERNPALDTGERLARSAGGSA